LTLRTRKGYPLKATVINRYIIAVKVFIKYLSEAGLVLDKLSNALSYLKEPKRLPKSVLTHTQVKKLLSRIPTTSSEGYRNRTMFELLYSTGLRAGELLKLNTEDIQFTHKTALINGKGNKQRMVPIGQTAIKYLKTYVTAVRPYMVLSGTEKALFLGRDGTRLSYGVFRRIVCDVSARSELDIDITAHTFRRSCATELIKSGANMYHVKELLGHESLDTLKHYARLTIIDLKKTHEKCHPREKDKE
jgi:integrase/recombinase XerD